VTAQTESNKKIVRKLLLLVVAMFGFGFALVPLYDIFCDVTGLNGKTSGKVEISKAQQVVDKNRLVTVQFIASLNENMPWEFKPVIRQIKVHPGESTKIEYIARNTTEHTIVGQAVPSVAPGVAASYFKKIECFCFTEQELAAGEEKRMPVIFTVDSSLPDDINELTLSYTFFIKSEKAEKPPLAMNHNQEI
jgi:cytochrome c oxidase assembly protein subunit 11